MSTYPIVPTLYDPVVLIHERDLKSMYESIKYFLADGWQLLGAVQIGYDPHSSGISYLATMVPADQPTNTPE